MGEAAPKDNSMEEILASIRRIISSDDEAPSTGRKPEEKDKAATPQPAAAGNSVAAPLQPASQTTQPTGQVDQNVRAPVRQQSATEPQAGTLAGLAQQLRGTRGLEAAAQEQPAAPETAFAQTPAPQAVDGSPAGTATAAVSERRAHPGAGAGGSAQSLADLAKSIHEKIEAASREEPVAAQPDTAKAESGSIVAPAEMSSDTPRAETAPGETLAGLAAAVSADTNSAGEETGFAGKELPAVSGPGSNKAALAESPASATGDDQPEAFREALVSPATHQAVSGSMDRLKQATADVSQAQVEAVLRPLLKSWLDDNLPAMVERMVQREIDRIATQADGGIAEDDLPQAKSA